MTKNLAILIKKNDRNPAEKTLFMHDVEEIIAEKFPLVMEA